MFEMLVTIAAAVIATLYGFSKSIFMNGPHQRMYRFGLIGVIVCILLFCIIYRQYRNHKIRRMNVNLGDYLYYHKFTSPLYRIGYLISYVIQNIFFDYTYMKRNFNFCKGLNVYDDNVSEYYIKFRNTWYQYLGLLFRRHRISISRLRAFAAEKKNEMIYNALETEEEKALYTQFRKDVDRYYEEHNHNMNKSCMGFIPNHEKIYDYYKDNLGRVYISRNYVEEHEPKIQELVSRKNARDGSDVNDFKKWIR